MLQDGSINAAPFNERTRRLLGPSVQVATGIALTGTGIAQFAISPNGTLAYLPETPRSLVLVDRQGRVEAVLDGLANLHAPQFSPDGRRVSFDITSADGRDVWIYSLDQRTVSRATFDRDGHDATWSPDGRFLTYTSFKGGERLGIYRTRPGSTAPAESLLASPNLAYSGRWLADGQTLITDGADLQNQSSGDIVRVGNGGRGPIEPLVASPFLENYAAPSADGRWLAFVSDQSGRQEVYVQPLTGGGDQVQVSAEGGIEPVWAPDGRQLFYRTISAGQPELLAATLRTTPEVAVVDRKVLFPVAEMVSAVPHANYDISPDGRHFVMVRRSPGSHIMVIQNLPALLREIRSSSQVKP